MGALMKAMGPFVPDVALDNPFEIGDGWIYFTSNADIVRTRKKKWETVAHLKERINCVVVEADGRFACAGQKGILHRWDGSSWTRQKLGFASVLGLVWSGGARYVAAGSSGEVAFVDGKHVARNDLGHAVMNCASESNRTWFVGEGVHRHDGNFYTREHEVSGISICVGDTIYVGTPQRGPDASRVVRRVSGSWEELDLAPMLDEDILDLAWWQGALWIANTVQLGRYEPGGAVEIVRNGATDRVGVVHDRIVTCARGSAAMYDGATWLSLV
ncbi:MAG: hypothetical protein KF773_20045 [Deltaproteobacteria bacterium]|nr:hypothetical protein [Deltaproteobacteria bacterium]MCW5809073.1 hypothetical protein [Deltaproteobacteria bacterium]